MTKSRANQSSDSPSVPACRGSLPRGVPRGLPLWLLVLLAGLGVQLAGCKTESVAPDPDGDGDGVAQSKDCDDTDETIYPGATELCNGVDDDCNGQLDDGLSLQTWYQDQDGDGYGALDEVLEACEEPAGYVADSSDCNDDDANVFPSTPELCNGLDDNCSSTVDEDLPQQSWYIDEDGDGHGSGDTAVEACAQPADTVESGDDCDDGDAGIYPGAAEVCNGEDDNCNDAPDEGLTTSPWYPDKDGDGSGDASLEVKSCQALDGYVDTAGDCDDLNEKVYPGAEELCDGYDNDCDGQTDTGCAPPRAPVKGELIITEIMKNPQLADDSVGEWFEVYNAADGAIDLTGLKLKDNTTQVSLPASLVIQGHAHAVFARSGDYSQNGGIVVTFAYGDTLGLGNGADYIEVLSAAGEVLDRVAYDDGTSFPDPTGASMNLDRQAYDINQNDGGASWCTSVSRFGSGDLGTPGAPNIDCALTLIDVDLDGYSAAVDCDDADANIHPENIETCNEIDDDCDGMVDEKPACDPPDYDRDGVPVTVDCDDTNSTIYPGALDIPYDGIDQDCDGKDAVTCGGELRIRMVAANLTSGDDRTYDPGEGIRILQGLKPDVVTIQEMNYGDNTPEAIRTFVDVALGPDFDYCRGPDAAIPNGIISRWPILECGSWDDTLTADREFTYAHIDIPGPIDLWAVSLHLLTSSSDVRNQEARALVKLVQASIPEEDFLVMGGDLNTGNESEPALDTLSQVVSLLRRPVDGAGNSNTSANRSKPYDWVMPDLDLEAQHAAVQLGSSQYPQGLVFDSRVYEPLAEVWPAEYGDSAAAGMQHMAVVKDFRIDVCN